MATRWTVYGTDAGGQATSVTVDANSEQDAIRIAGERGLQTSSAYATPASDAGTGAGTTSTAGATGTPGTGAGSVTPPPMTSRPAGASSFTSSAGNAARSAAAAAPDWVRSLMSPVGIVASAALLLALIAFIVALTRGGGGLPGEGLDEYDFDEPEEAVRSMLEIDATGDTRAEMEIAWERNRKKREKKEKALKTLEFHKGGPLELEDDQFAVRYSVTEGGVERHRVATVEKRKDEDEYDVVNLEATTVNTTDADIQREVRKWLEGDEDPENPEREDNGKGKGKKTKNPLDKKGD